MNIDTPPKEECKVAWRKFVKWMDVKMSEDTGPIYIENIGTFNINFRQHEFSYCPFCGITFDITVPIYNRHG